VNQTLENENNPSPIANAIFHRGVNCTCTSC